MGGSSGVKETLSICGTAVWAASSNKRKVWNTSKSEGISSFHLAIMAHFVSEFNFLLITMLCVDWWFK